MFSNVWPQMFLSTQHLMEILPKTVPCFKLGGVQSPVAWITGFYFRGYFDEQ
jgi:hypothetical protein